MAHIIVVGDDSVSAQRVTLSLQQAGHTVIGVADGSAAFRAIHDHVPHLILLDVVLPGKNGVELLRLLKHRLETRHIPVFMLASQLTTPSMLAVLLDYGAAATLTKPIDLPDLLARIAQIPVC